MNAFGILLFKRSDSQPCLYPLNDRVMQKKCFFFIWFFFTMASLCSQDYDLLIRNGKLMDGTGNPWFYADIGILNGQIEAIGDLSGKSASEVLDVEGKVVTPGFIDIHSHADDGAFGNRRGLRANHPKLKAAHNLVMQGITTVVVNHDGRSQRSIRAQVQQLEEQGTGPNVALMVGHNTIRRLVMSPHFQRLSTEQEVERMRAMIREGMEAGAFGLSAGLEYVPGRWSNTEEVIALVDQVADFGGVYIVHERFSGSDPMWYLPSRDGESPGTILDNIKEVIRVARETGVTSCATHLKVKGADYWGKAQEIIDLVNEARADGVDVWADQYPYNTTGTDGNTVLIPDWALDRDRWGSGSTSLPAVPNYQEALAKVVANEEKYAHLKTDVLREIERRGGPGNVIVFEHPDTSLIGKSIADIAAAKELDLLGVALYLQMEGDPNRPGGGRLRGFSLSEEDIELFAAQPWVITATDAGIGLPEFGSVHARYYGSFPRKIARYAKERKVITVEHAIRSMTSLPAQFMGFKDRGMLIEGYEADLVIFDLDRLQDKATFFNPHQYCEGIEQVIVNGDFLVRDGVLQTVLPGQVLRVQDSRRYRGPKR